RLYSLLWAVLAPFRRTEPPQGTTGHSRGHVGTPHPELPGAVATGNTLHTATQRPQGSLVRTGAFLALSPNSVSFAEWLGALSRRVNQGLRLRGVWRGLRAGVVLLR